MNQIEWLRRQLLDLQAVVADTGDGQKSVVEAIEEVGGTLIAVEEKLIQMKLTGTGQDRVRWPAMLSGRFDYLIRNVATYDFPPNDQQREVQAVLKDRMQGVLDELKSIVDSDVTSLNQALGSQGFPTVMIGTPEP